MMKVVYPIVITAADEGGFCVHIPDWDADTQGESFAECIENSRDVIGLMGIDFEDDGKPLPSASPINSIECDRDSIVTLVDVDLHLYRAQERNRAVKKNCTIPFWLCNKAEAANINFSQVLQNALRQELGC